MTQPKGARNVRGLGRVYWSERAQADLPSITNVQGMKDKPELKFWAAKVVAEYAVDRLELIAEILQRDGRKKAVDYLKREPLDSTDGASERGTGVHDYLERRARGADAEEAAEGLPESAKPYLKHAERFLQEWQPEFLHVEVTVFSESRAYAGTFDFIARLPDGRVVLGDYKTAKRIYPDTALQLAAARYADRMELGDGLTHPVPEVDQCLVVRIGPRTYEVREVRADREAWIAFRALRYVWGWWRDERHIVGPQLPPPHAAEKAA